MEVVIKGEAKEIAALVLAVQEIIEVKDISKLEEILFKVEEIKKATLTLK